MFQSSRMPIRAGSQPYAQQPMYFQQGAPQFPGQFPGQYAPYGAQPGFGQFSRGQPNFYGSRSAYGGVYRRPVAPSGPQLPFTKELLDRVPQENVGASLPYLGEIVEKAEHFVHPLPSNPPPFLSELKHVKPAAAAADVPIARYGLSNKLSQAVVFNNVAYLSGQVPGDRSGDITAQTKDVLEKIEFRLKELGSDKSKLLTAQIWLANIKDAKAFNAAWEEWVPNGTAPARALVEAKLSNPEWKVEVQVQAAIC